MWEQPPSAVRGAKLRALPVEEELSGRGGYGVSNTRSLSNWTMPETPRRATLARTAEGGCPHMRRTVNSGQAELELFSSFDRHAAPTPLPTESLLTTH